MSQLPLESPFDKPNLAQFFRIATFFDVRVFTKSKVLVTLIISFFPFCSFTRHLYEVLMRWSPKNINNSL